MPQSDAPSEPQFLPPQTRSAAKDFSHATQSATHDDAEEDFLDAKDRLLDVNNWHHLAGALSARFQLCDAGGKSQSRTARQGDLIRISVPGPGHAGGEADTDDWVQIEAVAYDDFPDEDRERIALQVRPTASPHTAGSETRHFFSDEATSTFSVERRGLQLLAGYWGRNEVPNTDGDGFLDTVRNVAIAVGGILGVSDLQWKSLIEGILQPPQD